MITKIGNGYDYNVMVNAGQTPKKALSVPKNFSPLNSNTIVNYYNYIASIRKPLAFKGSTFEETIDANYFQLPIINGIQALPDKTQLAAAKSLYEGANTVCIAPTGTGKTAIANYVITKNLEKGKKTYYTTPLKALSNDKYREFCKIYGQDNVGLLTGDIKLKKDAPVLIMTTEIFRNMALANYANPQKRSFKDVETVVFDEAHYINEEERGKIWEEAMMLTPKGVQVLPLSATIGNAKQFSDWIESTNSRTTNLIEASPKDRYVPLVYYNYNPKKQYKFQELISGKVNIPQIARLDAEDSLSERQARALHLLEEKTGLSRQELLEKLNEMTRSQPTNHAEFAEKIRGEFKFRELAAQEITQLLIDSDTKKINKFAVDSIKLENGNYAPLIQDLRSKEKLPAIIFKFSRATCNKSAKDVSESNLELTSDAEKAKISEIIKEYTDNGVYLGKHFDPKQLLNGVASHNAGLMPGYKKLVEDLFSKKLLKVVFATSTLSAGINMPAKTVVVTQLERPTHEKGVTEPLTANEFHQMSGRAGRRGIDTIGNVVLYDLNAEGQELAERLVLQKADPLTSKYKPGYSFLTSYYQEHYENEPLKEFTQKTLKFYQANDKNKAAQALMDEMEAYKNVLIKLGFLEETGKDELRQSKCNTNAKGALLSKVHGYNELTLVEMINDQRLENLNEVELAAFASSMVSSNIEFEDDVKGLVSQLVIENCDENSRYELLDAMNDCDDYDARQESAEQTYGIIKEDGKTDIFSAYVGYRWASACAEGKNSIEAFKNILADPNQKKGQKPFAQFDYNPFKKAFEGDLYGILSQSVDVLKQIINICEFAIESPEFINDQRYYKNLLKTAKKSVDLVKMPPIHDSLSVA